MSESPSKLDEYRARIKEAEAKYLQHKKSVSVVFVPVPEDEQVAPRQLSEVVMSSGSGGSIYFQKCGGGRRVIKKRIGGN